jgi:NgoMIV restriction enzyme
VATPAFVLFLLGWSKTGKGKLVPNVADSANKTSVAISSHAYNALGITGSVLHVGQEAGRTLEEAVRAHLAVELPRLDPTRKWDVQRKKVVSAFEQYTHLADLQALIDGDAAGTLSTEIGTDYLIKPDVTVAVPYPGGGYFLHAAVPCKWTIRSDRVQNIRHEGVILTRHRRGRQPHIVTVTPEPLPSRIASIARGTGEVDAVYHLMLDELVAATNAVAPMKQRVILEELVAQRRLRAFDELAPTLVL